MTINNYNHLKQLEEKILNKTIKDFSILSGICLFFCAISYLINDDYLTFTFGGFAFLFVIGLIFALIEKIIFLKKCKYKK